MVRRLEGWLFKPRLLPDSFFAIILVPHDMLSSVVVGILQSRETPMVCALLGQSFC